MNPRIIILSLLFFGETLLAVDSGKCGPSSKEHLFSAVKNKLNRSKIDSWWKRSKSFILNHYKGLCLGSGSLLLAAGVVCTLLRKRAPKTSRPDAVVLPPSPTSEAGAAIDPVPGVSAPEVSVAVPVACRAMIADRPTAPAKHQEEYSGVRIECPQTFARLVDRDFVAGRIAKVAPKMIKFSENGIRLSNGKGVVNLCWINNQISSVCAKLLLENELSQEQKGLIDKIRRNCALREMETYREGRFGISEVRFQEVFVNVVTNPEFRDLILESLSPEERDHVFTEGGFDIEQLALYPDQILQAFNQSIFEGDSLIVYSKFLSQILMFATPTPEAKDVLFLRLEERMGVPRQELDLILEIIRSYQPPVVFDCSSTGFNWRRVFGGETYEGSFAGERCPNQALLCQKLQELSRGEINYVNVSLSIGSGGGHWVSCLLYRDVAESGEVVYKHVFLDDSNLGDQYPVHKSVFISAVMEFLNYQGQRMLTEEQVACAGRLNEYIAKVDREVAETVEAVCLGLPCTHSQALVYIRACAEGKSEAAARRLALATA